MRAVWSGASGSAASGRELVAHAGEDALALLVDERLVEPAEADAAGEVADDGEAQLGRDDEAVERVAGGRVERRRRDRLGEPALEDRGRELHLGGRALLGEEDAEDRLLEVGRALEVGDAVVAQDAGELVAEVLREAGPVDVEALEVGVEVLARAVHEQLGVPLLGGRPVAAQLGEVGEQLEDRDLLAERDRALRGELVARREVAGEHPPVAARVAVEAEDARGEVLDAAVDALAHASPGRRSSRAGRGRPSSVATASADLGLVAGGLEAHERCAGLDLAADGDEQLAHARREGRRQHRLHLHRLEDEHRRAGGDLVAHLGRGRDDERGCGRAHDAALVAGDAVGDAVDLDEVDGAVGGGDRGGARAPRRRCGRHTRRCGRASRRRRARRRRSAMETR